MAGSKLYKNILLQWTVAQKQSLSVLWMPNSTAHDWIQNYKSTYLRGLDDTFIAVGVCLNGESVPVLALYDAVLGHSVLRFIWVLN